MCQHLNERVIPAPAWVEVAYLFECLDCGEVTYVNGMPIESDFGPSEFECQRAERSQMGITY